MPLMKNERQLGETALGETAPGTSQVPTYSSMAALHSEEANRNKLLPGAAKQTGRHHL